MKKWIALLLLVPIVVIFFLTSVGCSENKRLDATTVKGTNDLKRYENDEVVCYRVYLFEGIWCYRKEQNRSCPAPGN